MAYATALPAADPKATAKAEPKPGLIATTYTAPVIPFAPAIEYRAPITYSNYLAPAFYEGYPLNHHLVIWIFWYMDKLNKIEMYFLFIY